jgi:hypothetical protein
MAYKIQYFRQGKRYAEVYWDFSLPDTRETAINGLKRNKAEYAAIIDLDNGCQLVVKERA